MVGSTSSRHGALLIGALERRGGDAKSRKQMGEHSARRDATVSALRRGAPRAPHLLPERLRRASWYHFRVAIQEEAHSRNMWLRRIPTKTGATRTPAGMRAT
jgi:hypothetical protein